MRKALECGECSACCQTGELKLLPIDYDKYPFYWKEGEQWMERIEGACVYVTHHCSIHETRPQACKDFDCRDWIDHPDLPESVREQARQRYG